MEPYQLIKILNSITIFAAPLLILSLPIARERYYSVIFITIGLTLCHFAARFYAGKVWIDVIYEGLVFGVIALVYSEGYVALFRYFYKNKSIFK